MTGKKIVIGAIIAFLLLGAAGIFIVWYESRAGQGLDVKVQVPSTVLVGTPFEIEVEIGNETKAALNQTRWGTETATADPFGASSPFSTIPMSKCSIGGRYRMPPVGPATGYPRRYPSISDRTIAYCSSMPSDSAAEKAPINEDAA